MISDGAPILDIRNSTVYEMGHLDGAYNIPWAEIKYRGFELPPREIPMVVCCAPPDVDNIQEWFATRDSRCIWQVLVWPMIPNALSGLGIETGPTPQGRFLFQPSPLLRQCQSLLEHQLKACSAPRALDVGAGSGRDAIILATLGWDVTALDRDKAGLERWAKLAVRQECAERCHALHCETQVIESS